MWCRPTITRRLSSCITSVSSGTSRTSKSFIRQETTTQLRSFVLLAASSTHSIKTNSTNKIIPTRTKNSTNTIMCPTSTTSTSSKNNSTSTNGTTVGSFNSLPSSMMEGTKPISALVPPGQCQFNDTAQSVSLLERYIVSPTSCVLRFAVPDKSMPLNLSTCACILAVATINDEVVVRPYTPITTNADIGYFDLLIKNYGPTSKMSHYMCDVLQPGETTIAFKHISFNVKLQAPFPYKHIGMLIGGTGITPMVQALHAILGDTTNNNEDDEKKTKVTMLYGSRTSDDILGKQIIDEWIKEYPDQLECIHVLSHEPDTTNWTGLRGFITKELIEQYFPQPTATSDFQIFICGPPPMYDFFTGPRTEKEVTGLLGSIGYQAEHVYKF